MTLADHVSTFGQAMLRRYGQRVHKVALDAGLTCPNRDGSKGLGGCSFCNNVSFSPNGRQPAPLREQLAAGRAVIRRRTGARLYLAYFQAYTNTYADVASLDALYRQALEEPDVVGLSVGLASSGVAWALDGWTPGWALLALPVVEREPEVHDGGYRDGLRTMLGHLRSRPDLYPALDRTHRIVTQLDRPTTAQIRQAARAALR